MKRAMGLVILLAAVPGQAKDKAAKTSLTPLEEYLRTYSNAVFSSAQGPAGSLWREQNAFAEMSGDYKALKLNDLVTIRIVEQTLAQASADVSAQRKVEANSGIASIAGQSFAHLDPLLNLHSDNNLSGKGQANSQTKLQTSVSGRIVAVLPNGVLIVEAERFVQMNNETQTIVLRGMVRPGDVQSDNSVLSTSLGNLEIRLKGKGVVSDATRPANRLIRALFWLVGF
jgi:flagellar L-ring protein FlgH